jgi:glycosyltransferase involved in cell wall biosynthesis
MPREAEIIEGGWRLEPQCPAKAASDAPPVMSIITFCRNAGKTLQRAIDSVQAQTFPNREYIVVDGASTDDTMEILRRNSMRIDYWRSEPDQCASDGQNKGMQLARGDYFFFVNADDWIGPSFAADAVDTLRRSGCDFAFGDVALVENGEIINVVRGSPSYARTLKYYHSIPTISAVYTRRFLEVCGPIDLRYTTASDYEWFMRAHARGLRGAYDARLKAYQETGGRSRPARFLDGWRIERSGQGPDIQRLYGVGYVQSTVMLHLHTARYIALCALKGLLPTRALRALRQIRLAAKGY